MELSDFEACLLYKLWERLNVATSWWFYKIILSFEAIADLNSYKKFSLQKIELG